MVVPLVPRPTTPSAPLLEEFTRLCHSGKGWPETISRMQKRWLSLARQLAFAEYSDLLGNFLFVY